MAEERQDKSPWKDHPVVIAALSVAGALVFAQTVIFPTMTASLQNENSSLRSQVQEIPALKENLKKAQDSAKAENQRMDEALKQAKSQLLAAQQSNLFSLGNPYPVGFGKVKLGDGLNTLINSYPEPTLRKTSQRYWTIKPDHPVFRDVSFLFDRPADLKDRRIHAILFFANDLVAGTLQDRLIEALGQPSSPGPLPECFIWTLDKSLFVKKDSATSFAILNTPPDCKPAEK